MSSGTTPTQRPITLEQLIALNDEIVSLVRAGVPLELGLRQVAADDRDALSSISRTLAERMSRGEGLDEALAAESAHFPAVYATVVTAGLKAGRLPAALEALSVLAWELIDLRRRIGLALMYPAVVILLAYGLFLVFILNFVERLEQTHEIFRIPVTGSLKWLVAVGDAARMWWWIPPALMLLALTWWLFSSGSRLLEFRGLSRPLGWIPGVKAICRNFRYANFSDLLALLVEQGVPLEEGLQLAADATGDASMQAAARRMSAALSRGESSPASGSRGFPPFLTWLLAYGRRQGSVAYSLRLAADRYRRVANEKTERFKFLFPLIAGLGIGGCVTAVYALTLFYPFVEALNQLAREGGAR